MYAVRSTEPEAQRDGGVRSSDTEVHCGTIMRNYVLQERLRIHYNVYSA